MMYRKREGVIEREGERERGEGGERESVTDRQAGRQAGRQTDREKYGNTQPDRLYFYVTFSDSPRQLISHVL